VWACLPGMSLGCCWGNKGRVYCVTTCGIQPWHLTELQLMGTSRAHWMLQLAVTGKAEWDSEDTPQRLMHVSLHPGVEEPWCRGLPEVCTRLALSQLMTTPACTA
jgi:hypothetical protein